MAEWSRLRDPCSHHIVSSVFAWLSHVFTVDKGAGKDYAGFEVPPTPPPALLSVATL